MSRRDPARPADPAPDAPRDADDDSPLFRPEAMAARRPQLVGEVLLTPHALSGWTAALAALLGLALIAFATWGSYTRRATVSGVLVPASGVTRLTAPQSGVVLEQHVAEGEAVTRGAVLFVLSTDRPGADRQDYQAAIAGSMTQRLALLQAEKARAAEAAQADVEALRQRTDKLRGEREQVARQIAELEDRVYIATDAAIRYRQLLEQGAVARDEVTSKDAEASDLRNRISVLRRDDLGLQREIGNTTHSLEAARARLAGAQQTLERDAAGVREQLADMEARRRVVLSAPRDGVATLVQTSVGTAVEAGRPLALLVDAQAPLEAVLYAPSRTVGFVRPGTAVWLRYAAYPYQKFGHQRGEVIAVSAFPAPLADLPGVVPAGEPAGEALYAVKVRLAAQTIDTYGQAQPLRAGLRVDADFLLERRRLYEWMLEPLLSLRRSIRS